MTENFESKPAEYNALFDFNLDHIAKGYLTEAARWAKFLAIVAFVMFGLLLVVGAYTSYRFSQISYSYSRYSSGLGSYMFAVYLLVVALYFYPAFAMYKFGTLTKSSLIAGDQHTFNDGLRYLRGMFRYMGIITIIVVGFYVLAILISLLAGALR